MGALCEPFAFSFLLAFLGFEVTGLIVCVFNADIFFLCTGRSTFPAVLYSCWVNLLCIYSVKEISWGFFYDCSFSYIIAWFKSRLIPCFLASVLVQQFLRVLWGVWNDKT